MSYQNDFLMFWLAELVYMIAPLLALVSPLLVNLIGYLFGKIISGQGNPGKMIEIDY